MSLEYHVEEAHPDHKGDWRDLIGERIMRKRMPRYAKSIEKVKATKKTSFAISAPVTSPAVTLSAAILPTVTQILEAAKNLVESWPDERLEAAIETADLDLGSVEEST